MRLRWDRFQILALASAVGAFVLLVAGGFVTQTGSGLGCPDWPLCHGKVVPDFSNANTAIEWTHRTVAAIVGVLVLVTTFFAWRDRRGEVRILWTATMSLVLVIVQAGLGGATVLSELNPVVVVIHLSMASAVFAMAVATALLAFILPRPVPAGATGPAPDPVPEGRL
jgi:heme A synthase